MGEAISRERATFPAERALPRRVVDSALSSGGLLTALATSSCCLIPFALFSLGVSGAWIGNLTALEPYQPVFFAVSAALIGVGYLRIRRRSRMAACRSGTVCADPRAGHLMKGALLAAAALAVAGMAFSWGFPLVTGT